MGIRLIVEVLDHAPAELTSQERLLLVAIAEKASDQTRTCWPGMATLTRRTGLSDRQVRRMLADLAQRGYEVRVPSGVDKRGMPVFARKGHQTVYRVPTFDDERRTHTTASEGDAHDRLCGPKADRSVTQRRTSTVAKADVRDRPFPQEPSRDPSNHPSAETAAVVTALKKRTGKTITDCHAMKVIKQLVGERTDIGNRVAFLIGAISKDSNPTRFLLTPTPPTFVTPSGASRAD